MRKLSLLILTVLLLTACSTPETQVIVVTDKPKETATAIPPTNTPTITNTSPPSTPTRTPTIPPSPTPEPEPIILTGSGDAIVDIEKLNVPMIVHIVGNPGSHHFAVINYDENNEQIDLLVNTTDPYDGVRPLDFKDDVWTVRFEVKASGDWTIEVLPLKDANFVIVPGIIQGEGDDVIFLLEGRPDTATIKGNSIGHHFAVISYGNGRDLLVNTTDPYEGTVMLDPSTVILEIKADGAWEIEITAE